MSVRLKDRRKSPVGGFQFYQAETNFDLSKACPLCRWDFKLAVDTLRKHRLANPRFKLSTDPVQIAQELDTANAMRMLSIRNAESYIVHDVGGAPAFPKSKALEALQRQGAAGAGVVSKLAGGAALIIDWLGDGAEAVPNEQAEQRAETCAGCKFNDRGDWTRYFTVAASEKVRKTLDKRNEMGMSTTRDGELSICEICSCPLKLKVHVPRAYIDKHMPKEVAEDLKKNAPWCWIVKSEQ